MTELEKMPPLPKPSKLRRQIRHDGGYDMVPAYTAEEMEAYAQACLSAHTQWQNFDFSILQKDKTVLVTRSATANKLVADLIYDMENGFVRCDRCGDQEDTKNLDFMSQLYELRTALAASPAQVPDGWLELLSDAIGIAQCVGVSEAALTTDDICDAETFICKASAALAAAPQPKGGE